MAPSAWTCFLSSVLVMAICAQPHEPQPWHLVASRGPNLSDRPLHPEPGSLIHSSHVLRADSTRLDATSRTQAETLVLSLTADRTKRFQSVELHTINQRATNLRAQRRDPMLSTLFNNSAPNNTSGITHHIRAHPLNKRSPIRLRKDLADQVSGLSFLMAPVTLDETDHQTFNNTFESGGQTDGETVTKSKLENHMAGSSHDNEEGDGNISTGDQIPGKKPTRPGHETESSTHQVPIAPYDNLQLLSSNISLETSTPLAILLTSSSSGTDVTETTMGETPSTQVVIASSESPKTFEIMSTETEITSRTITGSFATRDTGTRFVSIENTSSSYSSSRETPKTPSNASKTPTEIPSVITANTASGASPEDSTIAPEETTTAQDETTAEPEKTTAAQEETTAAAEETSAAPDETTAESEETTAAPDEARTISQEASMEETTLTPSDANTSSVATSLNYRTSTRAVTNKGDETPEAAKTTSQTIDSTEFAVADDSSDDDWKIAVGLIVPIIFLVVALVAVYVCYRKKYPVRMIIGREFGKFSNPKYNARAHAPSLVREDADFYFNSNTHLSSQDMNPVNTKRSYDNLGFNKDDSSDEEEKERKFLQKKSWLFKNNLEESESADREKCKEHIVESSFIQKNTDSGTRSSSKDTRKSSTSSSECVVMNETPRAKPRQNKRRAPNVPAHTSQGSTEDTHKVSPDVTSQKHNTKITGNADDVSDVSSSSRRSSSDESSDKIRKSEMTHMNAAVMLGSSVPRNFETQINRTSSKEGTGTFTSLLSIPIKLFDRPSFDEVWDGVKARARSMSLDFIPLEDRERSCSTELSKTPRRMSLYEEIVLASKMKALGLPKRPSPLAYEALKKSSSLSEGLDKVSASVAGFNIRDRDTSVTSSLGSDQQVGLTLSPEQETAQDGTDSTNSTEHTLEQDFTPPETKRDHVDSQLLEEVVTSYNENHGDADNHNTQSPFSATPVSTTSLDLAAYSDEIHEQNNLKPLDIRQGKINITYLNPSLMPASDEVENVPTPADRLPIVLESSLQPLGSSRDTFVNQDLDYAGDLNLSAQVSSASNYSNEDSNVFETDTRDASEAGHNNSGDNVNNDPYHPENSRKCSSSEHDFNTDGDHLVTKPFGFRTSSSSSSSSSSSASISSASSPGSSSLKYNSSDVDEGLQTYSFPTSEIHQQDPVADVGPRVLTDSQDTDVRQDDRDLSRSKIPIGSPNPPSHGTLLNDVVDFESTPQVNLNQIYQRQISDSSSDSSFVEPRKGALVLSSPRAGVDSLAVGSDHEVKVTRTDSDSQSSSSREAGGNDDNVDIVDRGTSRGETTILRLQDSSYSDEDIDV